MNSKIVVYCSQTMHKTTSTFKGSQTQALMNYTCLGSFSIKYLFNFPLALQNKNKNMNKMEENGHFLQFPKDSLCFY